MATQRFKGGKKQKKRDSARYYGDTPLQYKCKGKERGDCKWTESCRWMKKTAKRKPFCRRKVNRSKINASDPDI